ncbi:MULTISPECIES: thioesterase family protein [Actinomadura]|uniref:Thioesterase family protein n=1 Tax=Actinomadura yumaensis TaxID=111807 RepID=A0ABW2CMB8_9ACTN|nr:thioesterase family protein [Actinomadura sp. J1-007]MWK40267.1 hypothetical protein [Actinomadura sp. J1-007]
MGDLAVDTAVIGDEGRYAARLSPDWEAWGPNGGYIAAVLLRAAVAHGSFHRVASIACHFLSVGRFAPVDLNVTTLRRTKRAESVRVVMSQEGRPIAEGLVWLVADHLPGLEHDVARMPEVPPPDQLPSFAELTSEDASPAPPMWDNIEGRPTVLYDDWDARPLGNPYTNGWYRFPAHTTEDAARQLVLLDVLAWSAAWTAYPPDNGFVAPNLDLNVQFHRSDAKSEWLFAEGRADVAKDGLIGFHTKVWSQQGLLLASGSGQLLCRAV